MSNLAKDYMSNNKKVHQNHACRKKLSCYINMKHPMVSLRHLVQNYIGALVRCLKIYGGK